MQGRILFTTVCFYIWKRRTALQRQPSCGGSQLHFTIYNAFYAPLLCKIGTMKRIPSLRNGIPAAPPLPHGHESCWRCSSAHWRNIPSTPLQSCSADTHGLLIFHASLPQRDGQGEAEGACPEHLDLYQNSFSVLVFRDFLE